MRLSTFKVSPPFPKSIIQALETLGLPSTDPICHEAVEAHASKELGRQSTPDSDPMNEAWIQVRVHMKSCFYVDRILAYSHRYAAAMKGVRGLIYALLKCAIKHKEASELYRTLARIARWLVKQRRLFAKPWKELPEVTVKNLRTKASLIKGESRSMDDCYDELLHLCRRCRMKSPNKIMLTYPHPNRVLLEWFEGFQKTCGWVKIPELFQDGHTSKK